ncbi:dipeptidase [Ruania alba]|uniref:Acetylornithine deacetylase/Succinyl-diaminopimelate desuccinylase n=1 Tax=Ruania alba TaxID=648782 RepID=A0A1H5HCU5_9MICO|nr:dipeptidase [Ruania alba]SEE25807.1 Acetylornithine deacetylase/Succinyl-diaminopimelate desuccinylase [Ruania alba]
MDETDGHGAENLSGSDSREDHPDLEQLAVAVRGLMPQALSDLAELVAFRSVQDPAVEDPEQCRLAAEWVRHHLLDLGLANTALVRTPDGSDAVIGDYQGPPGAPRVLLYAHYDVQPASVTEAWASDPFTLTERDGRYYGRGAADCKGSVVSHLTALRALAATGEAELPVSLTVVVEGSEEQGTGGLEQYVAAHPERFDADVIIIQDTGNVVVGQPTLTVALRGMADVVVRVESLAGELHSGAFGGAAPDALAALVSMLATLRDAEGNTTIDGLAADGVWPGTAYDEATFRTDAGLREGAHVLGSGTVADMVWARPAVTIIGIDAPPVVGAPSAIQPTAAARLNLRVPPGADAAAAADLLMAHLQRVAPWGVHVTTELQGVGAPFAARTDTPEFETLSTALSQAFGTSAVTAGQGGSIPLTAALASAHPDASIVMLGLSDPASQMHAPNESVHPAELEHTAVGVATFLRRLGARA